MAVTCWPPSATQPGDTGTAPVLLGLGYLEKQLWPSSAAPTGTGVAPAPQKPQGVKTGGAGGSQLLETTLPWLSGVSQHCDTGMLCLTGLCRGQGDRGCHPTQGPGLNQYPVNVLTRGQREGWQQRKCLNHIMPVSALLESSGASLCEQTPLIRRRLGWQLSHGARGGFCSRERCCVKQLQNTNSSICL